MKVDRVVGGRGCSGEDEEGGYGAARVDWVVGLVGRKGVKWYG